MSQIIVPSRKLWTPPQKQRGYVVLDGYRGAGGGGDPHWPNVASLLRFDSADGSTSFIDETGKLWTGYPGAEIDTSQSMFGGSSLLVNGIGGYINTASHGDFNFGSGDFTIEMFVRIFSAAAHQMFICRRNASGYTPFGIRVLGGKLGQLVSKTGSTWEVTSEDSVAFPANQWVHVVQERYGSTVTLYKAGTAVAASVLTGSVMTSDDPIQVSRFGPTGLYVAGHIDELRVTKGVARYMSNFTPPAAPFPNHA